MGGDPRHGRTVEATQTRCCSRGSRLRSMTRSGSLLCPCPLRRVPRGLTSTSGSTYPEGPAAHAPPLSTPHVTLKVSWALSPGSPQSPGASSDKPAPDRTQQGQRPQNHKPVSPGQLRPSSRVHKPRHAHSRLSSKSCRGPARSDSRLARFPAVPRDGTRGQSPAWEPGASVSGTPSLRSAASASQVGEGGGCLSAWLLLRP